MFIGWVKLHQYVYVKHANTDDHGWQYRSDWSSGVLNPKDEQWVNTNADGRDVRRRLWMVTVVKREDLIRSKKLLSDALQAGSNEVILDGYLYRLDSAEKGGKIWVKVFIQLLHNKIQFLKEENGPLQNTIPIQNCEVKMLFGNQCPGREFSFALRSPDTNRILYFDTDNKEVRRKWVVAISYQIALNSVDANFPPFDYGPPIDNDLQVLLCGDLQKRGHMVKNWKTRFFQLQPRELMYFEKDSLKGKIGIDGAIVETEDNSMEFSVKGASGAILLMRAESISLKSTWIRIIRRQIQALKDSKVNLWALTENEIDEVKVASKILEEKLAQEAIEAAALLAKTTTEDNSEEALVEAVEEMAIETKEDWVEEESEAVVETAVSATVEVVEKDDDPNDPYLQFGGKFVSDDKKNSPDYTFIKFSDIPLFTEQHKSLMSKSLRPEVFASLKDLATSMGYTLSNAITVGVVNPNQNIGITAGDEESYTLFKDIFHPIINAWHNVDCNIVKNVSDLDPSKLSFSESQNEAFHQYVISTRIRTIRNISGHALPCGTTDSDREVVEEIFKSLTSELTGDFAGSYYSLGTLSDDEAERLRFSNLLFEMPSSKSKLTGGGAARSWPNNRGIFVNPTNTIAAWINEEDHCRLFAQDNTGDVKKVFTEFVNLINSITSAVTSKGKSFMYSPSLGYLCTCPSELGTALKINIKVLLPEINKLLKSGSTDDVELVEKLYYMFDLEPGTVSGLFNASENDILNISNAQRMGVSEVQLTQKIIDGVSALIEVEKQLVSGSTREALNVFIDNGFKVPVKSAASWVKDKNPSIPKTTEMFNPANLRPARNRRIIQEPDELDDFGMKDNDVIPDRIAAVSKTILL